SVVPVLAPPVQSPSQPAVRDESAQPYAARGRAGEHPVSFSYRGGRRSPGLPGAVPPGSSVSSLNLGIRDVHSPFHGKGASWRRPAQAGAGEEAEPETVVTSLLPHRHAPSDKMSNTPPGLTPVWRKGHPCFPAEG